MKTEHAPLILILEDEAIVAMELEERLGRLGYRIAGPAATYEAALKLAEAEPPHLLVADIRIGGTRTGIDVAQTLQDRFGVPAVFLSAHADPATVQSALKTEPYGYLTKPFREQELHATIEMALQRHRLEHALARREAQLAEAQQLGHIGHWERDLNGGPSEMPEEVCRILGIDPAIPQGEMYGRFLACIHPEDRSRVQADIAMLVATSNPLDHRYRIVRPDGEVRYVHSRAKTRRNASGKVTSIFGMTQDVTEHERAVAELRESQIRFAALFESSPEALLVIDQAGRITQVNGPAKTMFGYGEDEFVGMPVEQLIPARLRTDHVKQRAAFGQSPRFRRMGDGRKLVAIAKDGRELQVEISLGHTMLGGQLLVMAAIRDISQRLRTEAALRASEAHFRTLFDQASDGIAVFGRDGNLVDVNASGCRMLGYSREELLQMKAPDLIAPEHLQQVPIPLNRLLSGEQIVHERVLLRKDGTRLPVEISARARPDGFLQAFVRDISERRRAQAALKASESHFRMLFDQASDGIFVSDRAGNYLDANASGCRMLGYSREELLRLNVSDIVAPEDLQRQPLKFDRLLDGQEIVSERKLVRRDGTRLPVEIIAKARPDGHLQAFIRDISERVRTEQALRQSEQRLRQSQKMEAVGQLAGGIAHDFNNMLQVVRGYTDLVYRAAAPDSPARAHLATVLEATQHGVDLTRQLLSFSRGQVMRKQGVDLVPLAEQQAKLLQRLIGEHIEMRTASKVPQLVVHGDPGMLQQVFLNLCVNARDAMPNGGEILMELDTFVADPPFCALHPEIKPGAYALLSLSDTGTGMTAEVREHIFEPFFTTKEVGKGTGLGLFTVYGIVRQHDGMIDVFSDPGLGTTFRILLPLSEAAPQGHQPEQRDGALEGTETVLVAEDDAVVRGLVVQLLRSKGYRVIEARDGREAVELYTRHRAAIDLALLDMVMPKQSGAAVFRQIKALNPGLPVIITTGYAGNIVDSAFIEENQLPVLRKPHLPNDLFRRLRETLDGRKP